MPEISKTKTPVLRHEPKYPIYKKIEIYQWLGCGEWTASFLPYCPQQTYPFESKVRWQLQDELLQCNGNYKMNTYLLTTKCSNLPLVGKERKNKKRENKKRIKKKQSRCWVQVGEEACIGQPR